MESKDESESGLDMVDSDKISGGYNNTNKSKQDLSNDNMIDPLSLDPDAVCHQLENINLTEEDTEILLKDALELNKILKEHLLKQEGGSQKKKSTANGKKPKKGTSSPGGDLPPLDTKRGLSAAQMRIRQPVQRDNSASKKLSTRSTQSPETKPVRAKTASSTSSRRRNSSKSKESNKKEWSDRW
ncbi:uncharacterized protein [Antedon mediterranea]|uniref:uncharacterized protein n=1 Tax=Antedon mediterranea TaxID=105859 RepID=UPI003AF461ED